VGFCTSVVGAFGPLCGGGGAIAALRARVVVVVVVRVTVL
jgi:hypothetical protein